MAYSVPPEEQYATTPCWPRSDEILRDRLAWLHHSLGCNQLALDEAADQFSHIVSDLLLKYGIIKMCSRTIFMARNCCEWSTANLM